MFDTTREVQFLSEHEAQRILDKMTDKTDARTLRFRAVILLMLDCGLRVSEACTLQVKHFDFPRRIVFVKSLKKRKDTPPREVPMTSRILEALADWWAKLPDRTPDAWLFPSESKENRAKNLPMSRITVWRYVKSVSDGVAHPHTFRHTFGTNLIANGTDIFVARDLLGHSHSTTTEIYVHTSRERRTEAIQRLEPRSLWYKLRLRFFPPKAISILPVSKGRTNFHVGRKQEIAKLNDLHDKRVNILLLGGQGIGKTHLLDNIQSKVSDASKASDTCALSPKLLRIDDTTEMKKQLADMLLKIHKDDKEAVAKLLHGDLETFGQVVSKYSVKRLTDELVKSTEKHEYTILIDDATKVTAVGVKALEALKHHFHFIVAARNVEIKFGSWLTNFEKIDMKPLTRIESMELIQRASKDFRNRIEDYEHFKNYVWNQTQGNPEYALDLIERLEKEAIIDTEQLNQIRHTAALPEWDMSMPILILLSSLMLLKYLGNEIDEDDSGAFKLFGGAFLILALFSRNLFRLGKRRYV